MATTVTKVRFQFLKFGNDIFDPTHRFQTSWLLPPWVLFGIRTLISLYAFTVLLFIIIYRLTHDQAPGVRLSFSYFTVLCYWGLGFYFLLAASHTLSYTLTPTRPLLSRFPRPLQALHSLFYTTITTFPLLVTLVYWSVLYTRFLTLFELWSNISQHGLNSAFALFEIVFTRTNPPPWIHLPFLILILLSYLGLAYITSATTGIYVYAFLDPSPPQLDAAGRNVGGVGGMVGAYCAGIAAGIVVLFCVVKGLVWFRKWASETKGGMLGRFAKGENKLLELENGRVVEKEASKA